MSQPLPTQNRKVTPPSVSAGQLPSPPTTGERPPAGSTPLSGKQSVIDFFSLLRLEQAPREPGVRKYFELAPGHYKELTRDLQRDQVLWGFVDDKIRYDYEADIGQLIVRMPASIHEFLIDLLTDNIKEQLRQIRSTAGPGADFAKNVRCLGSTDIPAGASKRSPDKSFGHIDSEFPGVIIEVGYSQSKKELRRKAEGYILDSDSTTQVVVGIDIAYRNRSRMAVYSIWRPRLRFLQEGPELDAVEEPVDKAFRDDDGKPVQGADLQLRLRDFALEVLANRDMGEYDVPITIPAAQLCQYLETAERESKKEQPKCKASLPVDTKKRCRSATPPEQIATDDEAEYVEEEERAEEQAARGDFEFVGPSGTQTRGFDMSRLPAPEKRSPSKKIRQTDED